MCIEMNSKKNIWFMHDKKRSRMSKKNKNGTQTRTQNPESMIAKAGQICVQD